MSQETLTEGWFVPMTGNRRVAHYLKNDSWLCGVKNWVPRLAIRGMLINIRLPHCSRCTKKLESES
jgi:hypothetical protein